VTSSTISATGLATQNIDRRSIGVILQVTPRITPEGKVVMRVTPEVSSIANSMYPLGNGAVGTSLNIQGVDTTVVASDGETVVLGGLIQKRDAKTENKIPVLGDLWLVGSLFRFRTQTCNKTELLVIMTPHVIRNEADRARILAEESARMDWIEGKRCGSCPGGLNSVLPTPTQTVPLEMMNPDTVLPPPSSVPTGPAMTVPPPAALPTPTPVTPPVTPPTGPSSSAVPPGPALTPASWPPPANQQPEPAPAAPAGKESKGWRLFRHD
jgi:hypothetical protein